MVPETDEEYNTRIEKAKERQKEATRELNKKREAADRREYERLKKKFEGK